jgi:hypothetical protein
VVAAIEPVTATAARARAAILVLIDMSNSILVWSGAGMVRMSLGRNQLGSGSIRLQATRMDRKKIVNTAA